MRKIIRAAILAYDFLMIFLLLLTTRIKRQFDIPMSIMYDQGLNFEDVNNVYLSEVSVDLYVLYDQKVTVKEISVDSIILENYSFDDDESNGVVTHDLTAEEFTLDKFVNLSKIKKDVESKCRDLLLSKFAAPEETLKNKLEQLEKKYLKIGYQLSIPVDSLENYYNTRGLVTFCSELENRSHFHMVIKIEVPFVRTDINFNFKKTFGLPFQNEYEDTICDASNNDVSEYILIRNGSKIYIPTTRVTITPDYFRGFEKCQLGGEVNRNVLYNRVCHLGKDVLNGEQKTANIPYVSCLKAVHDTLSREVMEKNCDLNYCKKRGEFNNMPYVITSPNPKEIFLTNINKTLKVRCSDKTNDVTMEKVPGDGGLLFQLTCGCQLLHGSVTVTETDRCKWYSKTIQEVDFSKERVKIRHMLPSKYIRDFQGYVFVVKDFIVRSNNISLISGVLILIEIGVYLYALRFAYLISLIFLGKNPLRKLNVTDLAGVLYTFLRFMAYWIPGWFFY